MSEPKLISPLLDNFAMGDPISEHNGVRCCPAMEIGSDDKYIVKIVSTPASQTQLEALLLSGAYSDKEAALDYFKALAEGITEEAQTLQKLSQLEGFVPFERWQIEPMDDQNGFDVYLLSNYRLTLKRVFARSSMTHLGALNLGLDLCAALAVSRRMGYLYVNLKPDNIYLTADNEYRIGDLGFMNLQTLKYSSLPERYRSIYTAPEIADAFSNLNTTVDIYAVGLILYQAFNDGVFPVLDKNEDTTVLQPPAYADYEMAEIILKACAENPEDRWQDPIEMGQALVSYMQRNGAHDTPIVPQVVQEEIPSDEDEQSGVFEETETDKNIEPERNDEDIEAEQEQSQEIGQDTESITEASIYTEDNEGNLTFIDDSLDDETAPQDTIDNAGYEEVSEEVSEILNQADELIAHETPDPVVPPEPIEVPIPEPIPPESETEIEATLDGQEASEDSTDDETEDKVDTKTEQLDSDDPSCEDDRAPTKNASTAKAWIRNCLLALLALAIIVSGIYYYKNFYLQPIDAILLQEGDNGTLTVIVNSHIDESKLTVICSDTYGNQQKSPVADGKAEFTGLAPNAAYTVRIDINGFHKLTGDTYAAYTTPVETNIVQFSAVTGTEDGSVILGFTIEGPDANQWKVRYGTDDTNTQELPFTGHMVTINGLTVGSEYTFTLIPNEDLLVTGTDTIKYTASKIVKAESLYITGCINNTLTATWTAPADTSVASWTVRCYADAGYDQTVVVSETAVSFEGIDPTVAYTLEVTASGMSVNERAFAPANSITVTEFTVDNADPSRLILSWNPGQATPENGWVLLYTMNGSAAQELKCESGNRMNIFPIVPGTSYTFTLQTADGTPVLGGNLNYTTPAAENFVGYNVSTEYMEFMMCKTPSYSGWDRYDLSSSDYTSQFSVDEKASFLVRLRQEYDVSDDDILILYVIKDNSDNIVGIETDGGSWTSLWYRNYGEFDIPSLPNTPGVYSISVYFNGCITHTQEFTIVD